MQVLFELPEQFVNLEEWAKWLLEQKGMAADAPSSSDGAVDGLAAGVRTVTSPAPEDPWAGMGDTTPPQNGQQAQTDPWTSSANPTGSGTTGATQAIPDQPPPYGTFVKNTDNGPVTTVFGKQGAPPCNHGQPAVWAEGSKNGKAWKSWACALSATKRWKEKCDFRQWA
jgi:hypothetical protein